MAWLTDLWPFVPRQQHMIFNVTGLAIVGLIALNLWSAVRQSMPIHKVISGLFVQIRTPSAIEKRVRLALIAFLLLGFFVFVIDIQVNGMQMVDPNWAGYR